MQRQVWLMPIADERVGVQVKLWDPLRTRVIQRICSFLAATLRYINDLNNNNNNNNTWALLRWCFTKRRYIKCTYLYLFTLGATQRCSYTTTVKKNIKIFRIHIVIRIVTKIYSTLASQPSHPYKNFIEFHRQLESYTVTDRHTNKGIKHGFVGGGI